MKIENTYYSTQDVADILGFSYNKINGLVKKGVIPSYKIGGQYRIDKNEFDKYMYSMKHEGKTKTPKREYTKRKKPDNAWNMPLLGNYGT